jgi:hypothetical protein
MTASGHLVGLLGVRVAPPSNRVMPLTQTVQIGALTLPGHGVPIGYTGTGTLSIVSATGNGATMYRVNGCNQLVRGGQADKGGAIANFGVANINSVGTLIGTTPASGTLARSYTVVVQDSVTGQQSTLTVNNSNVTTLPGQTIRGHDLSAQTIDWSQTFSVSPWPAADAASVADDYYTQTDMLTAGLEVQDQFNVACAAPKAVGQFMVIEPGAWQAPIFNASYGGTAAFDVRPFIQQAGGTFSGSSPEYNDGNWFIYTMRDPANTRWGQYILQLDTTNPTARPDQPDLCAVHPHVPQHRPCALRWTHWRQPVRGRSSQRARRAKLQRRILLREGRSLHLRQPST